VVSGRVQGVWYRDAARQEAEARGLAGSARNQRDGTVLLEVEGPPTAVEAFLAWAGEGPSRARVDRLEVTAVDPTGQVGFGVG
jgi:acylphosphatase